MAAIGSSLRKAMCFILSLALYAFWGDATAATKLFGDDKEAWVRDSVAKAREMGFNRLWVVPLVQSVT